MVRSGVRPRRSLGSVDTESKRRIAMGPPPPRSPRGANRFLSLVENLLDGWIACYGCHRGIIALAERHIRCAERDDRADWLNSATGPLMFTSLLRRRSLARLQLHGLPSLMSLWSG